MAHNNPSHLMPSGNLLSSLSLCFNFHSETLSRRVLVVSGFWFNVGVVRQSSLTDALGPRSGWSWRGTRNWSERCGASTSTSTWCWKMSLNSMLRLFHTNFTSTATDDSKIVRGFLMLRYCVQRNHSRRETYHEARADIAEWKQHCNCEFSFATLGFILQYWFRAHFRAS